MTTPDDIRARTIAALDAVAKAYGVESAEEAAAIVREAVRQVNLERELTLRLGIANDGYAALERQVEAALQEAARLRRIISEIDALADEEGCLVITRWIASHA